MEEPGGLQSMGYSPWSGKELDITEGLSAHTHIPGRASDSQLSVVAKQTNLRLPGQPRNWFPHFTLQSLSFASLSAQMPHSFKMFCLPP